MKIKLTTYASLLEYVAAFNHQPFHILVVESSPGLAKTTIASQVIPDGRVISGKVTAARLYDLLWEYKDELIIIDDVDDIYKDKTSVNILKCLCQTETTKTLTWSTRTRNSVRISPDEFTTSSRVILLTNSWKSLNRHVMAIDDRGIVIDFSPSAMEVHKYVISNLTNKINDSIIKFIESNLSIISSPSIRLYLNCQVLLDSGLDWQNALLQTIDIDDELALVLRLEQTIDMKKERIHIFTQETGKSYRTYYRLLEQLKKRGLL